MKRSANGRLHFSRELQFVARFESLNVLVKVQLQIGDAALTRVSYAEVLVDPHAVSITPDQLALFESGDFPASPARR